LSVYIYSTLFDPLGRKKEEDKISLFLFSGGEGLFLSLPNTPLLPLRVKRHEALPGKKDHLEGENSKSKSEINIASCRLHSKK